MEIKKLCTGYFCRLVLMLAVCASTNGEMISNWNILSAPISATIQNGNPKASIMWTNIYNTDIPLAEAFTGISIIDDGLGNLPLNTTITLTFAPGAALNIQGTDLVLFQGFSAGSYLLSTSYDNHGSSIAILHSHFLSTGIQRQYYYGLDWGPFLTPVNGAPIDLSLLGIPLGEYVNEIRLIVNINGADPFGIGSLSVPEPATLTMVVLGVTALFRKQK